MELDWYYGPTADDPEPSKRWHRGCRGEVWWLKDGEGGGGDVCLKCHATDGPDV